MTSRPEGIVSNRAVPGPDRKARVQAVLPNLIIAGVHKAGTTSLYSYLAKHPRICPSFTKEIGFFYPLLHGRSEPAVDEYARHFGHCLDEPFRMEASPSYLYGGERIAERIKCLSLDARIIVILRDPTERLISYFNRAVADSLIPEGMDFAEYAGVSVERQESGTYDVYARGFREGLYVDYLRRWDGVFRGDLKIVFFDDLRNRPAELVAGIVSWLGLDASALGRVQFTVENKTVEYRHRKLHRYVKSVYMRSEAFWRRHEALKKPLRRLYNFLNTEPDKPPSRIAEAAVTRVRELYAPHNSRLAEFLEERGDHSLPAWLHR